MREIINFGKYKGRKQNCVPVEYLMWAQNKVSFFKPTEKTLQRIEEHKKWLKSPEKRQQDEFFEKNKIHWDNNSVYSNEEQGCYMG